MPDEKHVDIRKNNHEVIRVVKQGYKGKTFLGIRVWFENDDGELKPSKTGINIPIDKAPEVLGAMLSVVSED